MEMREFYRGMHVRIDEKLRERIATALLYGIMIIMIVFWIVIFPTA